MRNATYATTEGKALGTRLLESGDLLISGWAAGYSGLDRERESFAPGAFSRSLKSFLGGQSALCFNHKTHMGIGRVFDLREVEGKGLWMEARVDKQEKSSPLYFIYNAIKKGSYRGISAAGYFKRQSTPEGTKIVDVDLTEFSICPVGVDGKTAVLNVSMKALGGGDRRALIGAAGHDLALLQIQAAALDARLERTAAQTAQTRLSL